MWKFIGEVQIPEMGRFSRLILLCMAVLFISQTYAAEHGRPQLAFSGLRFPCPNTLGSRAALQRLPSRTGHLFPYSRACTRRRFLFCQLDPGSEKFQALEKR